MAPALQGQLFSLLHVLISELYKMPELARTLPASWYCSLPLYQLERRAVFMKARQPALDKWRLKVANRLSLGISLDLWRSSRTSGKRMSTKLPNSPSWLSGPLAVLLYPNQASFRWSVGKQCVSCPLLGCTPPQVDRNFQWNMSVWL